MSYVIARTKDGHTEIYMDRFRDDESGEFRSPHDEGLNLPKTFRMKYMAEHSLRLLEEEEPGYIYEVREYLR